MLPSIHASSHSRTPWRNKAEKKISSHHLHKISKPPKASPWTRNTRPSKIQPQPIPFFPLFAKALVLQVIQVLQVCSEQRKCDGEPEVRTCRFLSSPVHWRTGMEPKDYFEPFVWSMEMIVDSPTNNVQIGVSTCVSTCVSTAVEDETTDLARCKPP